MGSKTWVSSEQSTFSPHHPCPYQNPLSPTPPCLSTDSYWSPKLADILDFFPLSSSPNPIHQQALWALPPNTPQPLSLLTIWNLNPGQGFLVSPCSPKSLPHRCALQAAVHTEARESFVISRRDLLCMKAPSQPFTEPYKIFDDVVFASFMDFTPPATLSLTSKLQSHVLLTLPGTVQHVHSS